MEFQLVSIAFCPFTGHPWKESGFLHSLSYLYTLTKSSPSPLFSGWRVPGWVSLSLKTVCKPLLIFVAFTALTPVCPCLSCTGGPKLDEVLQMWPSQAWRQGSTPQSAGNALSNSTQYTDGLNFWKDTFAGSRSTCYLQNPQVIYRKAAFQTVGPQPLLVHGVILPQV